ATAAAGYEDAARRLAELRDLLFHLVRRHGEDPAAASSPSLAALRRLHADTGHLLAAARTMGEALRAYGGEILPWYVEHAPDHGTTADDVDQYMRRLTARITELWHAFPEKIDGAADAPPPERREVRPASAAPSPGAAPGTSSQDGTDADANADGRGDASSEHHPAQQNQTVVPMIAVPLGGAGGGGRGGGPGARSRKGARRRMDVPAPGVKPAPGLIPDREPRIVTPGNDTAPKPSAAAGPKPSAPLAASLAAPAKPSLPVMPPAPEPGWVPPVSVAEALTAKPSDQASQRPDPAPLSPIAEALSAAKEDERKR
ncbi:hypothetical protein DZF91_06920, partial [Actinomadura logoneensis]